MRWNYIEVVTPTCLTRCRHRQLSMIFRTSAFGNFHCHGIPFFFATANRPQLYHGRWRWPRAFAGRYGWGLPISLASGQIGLRQVALAPSKRELRRWKRSPRQNNWQTRMVGSGDIPGYQQKYHHRALILMAPQRSKTLKRCAGSPSHYSLLIERSAASVTESAE